jgi:hypothetical protein
VLGGLFTPWAISLGDIGPLRFRSRKTSAPAGPALSSTPWSMAYIPGIGPVRSNLNFNVVSGMDRPWILRSLFAEDRIIDYYPPSVHRRGQTGGAENVVTGKP